MNRLHSGWPLLASLAMLACGGGGAGTTPPTNAPPTNPAATTWTPGLFQPSSSFASKCQVPRTGTDPATGRAYADVAGSTLAENHFLRSWSNELYLWYSEIPDIDPALATSALNYFGQLKTQAVLSSGRNKDQFHFTYDTAKYNALAQSGISVDYGIALGVVQGTAPRQVVVQYVQAGSQAATLGVTRGAEIQSIDGVNVVSENTQAGIDLMNAALFSPTSGSTHSLVFRTRAGTLLTTSLQATAVTYNPVPTVKVLPTAAGSLGYLLFNDHTISSEQALISAVNQLRAGNVQDLVLDLRYNGGGYLAIASELAYMIAGSAATAGKTFERLQFNNKYSSANPVTGGSLDPMPFLSSTEFSSGKPTSLPSLNLARVFVITSAETCSASESIINSLRGIGVQVVQIGGDTCGKPYGFYPRDNCGTSYFSIQFKGVNAVGFGDYAEGFSATRTAGEPQARLPGCPARDDFTRDLGDPQEERLRVAMEYRASGACTGTASALEAVPTTGQGGLPLIQPREPWRENRFLQP